MSVSDIIRATRPSTGLVYVLLAVTTLVLAAWQPSLALETARFVLFGLIHVTPIVIPGILLAAWIVASGASDRVAGVFQGHTVQSVVAATVTGALLPVCGITVLPLMAGLLAAGVPLAPVMAFWLASPITGPALLSVTVATLGWQYALGKTAAAIFLGLLGGGVTALVARREWARSPLRTNRFVGDLGGRSTPCGTSVQGFHARFWRDPVRRQRFTGQVLSISRLMLVVLTPAFAAEFLLNAWLQPDALADWVGDDNPMAIPFAVFVGGPAYIDGYAALPLTRALLDHGMSPGAAMAFLVSGGVVSIWGAMAIFPVLRFKPFMLYLALAAIGSATAGWLFGIMV